MAVTSSYNPKTKVGTVHTGTSNATVAPSPSSGSSSSGGSSRSGSTPPPYNRATGATTGQPSAEYNDYLKSLNRKGSANYVDPGVDTTQPNPATTQINPVNANPQLTQAQAPTVPYDQAVKNINAYGGSSATEKTAAINILKSKYAGGKAQADASGIEAGKTAGESMGMIQDTTGGTTTDASNVMTEVIDTEPGFVKTILEALDEYNSPENKRKSYVEEYKSMFGDLGISGINEKLLNLDNIIEGTEDDIRAEVTAVGGFATDSQVLALAQARNKQNIKDYNNLLETKKYAMQQLDTMMQLTMEDRKAAEADFDRKINFAFKVEEFTQKATENAKSGLRWVIENGGGSEILNNPYETSLAEKTLGVGTGGLAKLISAQTKDYSAGIIGEYQFAKEQGYKGSFTQYQNEDTNRKVTVAKAGVPTTLPTTQDLNSKETSEALGTVNDITNILDNPNFNTAFGVQGLVKTLLPNTPEYALGAQVQQVKDKLSLAARGKLKGQGQVSNFEGLMLSNAQTALRTGMNPVDAKQEFINIQGALTTSTGGSAKVQIKEPNGAVHTVMSNSREITQAIADGLSVKYVQ
jgi:predicted secreted protein